MARASWKNPPPVVVIAGNESFQRDRETRKAILQAARLGREVVWASADHQVGEVLDVVRTFGGAALILLPLKVAEPSTVKEILANPSPDTCLILTYDGPLTDNGIPAAAEVSEAFKLQWNAPKGRKAAIEGAVKFIKNEAALQLGNEAALETKLAEAIVGAAGSDIGTLAFEILKISTYVRALGKNTIEAEHVRALVRPTSEVDIEPLRDALRNRNGTKVAKEFERLRRQGEKDPIMLLLRAKGGVADLTLNWYRAALLLERGSSTAEIAGRMGVPEWIVEKDLLVAARRWGSIRLRELMENLAIVDRSVQLGAPSPITACEAALLMGCL